MTESINSLNEENKKTSETLLTFITKTQNGEYCKLIPGVENLRRNDFVYVENEDCKYSFGVRC